MHYFTLARNVADPVVGSHLIGLGLDAMRFSARRTKQLFPRGVGAGFGAQFGTVAAQLADDLRTGDFPSAERGLDSIIAGDAFDDPGSKACAQLFRQSCRDFRALMSCRDELVTREVLGAFPQTLDAAVLTLTVAQTDDAWASVSESIAQSQEIDIVHKAYLTFGGLDSEFLAYVAALESSARPDREQYAVQVSVNYREEAEEMRAGHDLLDALDFAHHVAAIATYAALLIGEADGPDQKPRRQAGEIATSCGSSLLVDIFGDDECGAYPLFVDAEHAATLKAARRAEHGPWVEVLPDDVTLQALGRALDARAGQPSVEVL